MSQSGYNTVSYTISIPNTAGDMTYAFPDMTKTRETATVQTPTVTNDLQPHLLIRLCRMYRKEAEG